MEEYIFEFTREAVNGMKNISLLNARCTGEKIVRCKDCEYFDNDFSSGWCERLFICDKRDGFSVNEDDYCSFGQTKDGD